MHDAARRRSGGARLAAIAALLALALAGALALAVRERRSIAERMVTGLLQEAGISEAAFEVRDVGLRALTLRNVRLGENDLTLRALDLRYSLAGLSARRLDTVRAEGLRLHARLRDGALELGALDALRKPAPGEPAAAPATLPALPFARLEVEDATLSLTGVEEGVDAEPRVAASLPALRVEAAQQIDGTLRIDGSADQVLLPALSVEATGIDFELALGPQARLPSGRVAIDAIRSLVPESPLAPVSVETQLAPEDGALAFRATVAAEQGVVLQVDGRHDPATGAGRATLALDPVDFAAEGRAPADLYPPLAGLVQAAAGTGDGHGELSWNADELSGAFELALRDVALQTTAARLSRVNAVVRVEGPWPPRVPPGQLVSMASVDFGLQLTDGLVTYGMRPGGVIDVQNARWRFAGGTVSYAGTVDLSADVLHVRLHVRDVDLAQLLVLVNLDGLSGEGRLSGELPVTIRGGTAELRGAALESSGEGGWIRYRTTGGAAALGAVGEVALGDLLEALTNFRFTRLRLALDGDTESDMRVGVTLQGANPEHRDNQPYDLNLNVEARLVDLLRQTGAAYEVPEEIEKRLQAIAERGR